MNLTAGNSAVLRLKLFTFFLFGPMALFLPYLPLYLQHNGFTPTQIGIVLSVGPIIGMVANPFWGYFSDRTQNNKLTMIILLAGTLGASQFLFHASSFLLIFLGMMLFYFFFAAITAISNSQIFQTIEGTPHRFGSIRLWGSLGYALIILASGPVMEALGIGRLAWVFGGAALIALLLALQLNRPRTKVKRPKNTITLRETARVLTQWRFSLFLLASFLIFIPNAMNQQYLSLFLEELGGAESSIGWSNFVAAFLEVPLFLLLDRFSKPDKMSMMNLLLLATAVYILRWVLMSLATEPIHIILIQSLHCISFGFYLYTAVQLVEMLIDPAFRASGQTMYALVQSALSMAVAGSLGGFLYETLGREMLFLLCTALTAVGFAVMAGLRSSFRKEIPRQAAGGLTAADRAGE